MKKFFSLVCLLSIITAGFAQQMEYTTNSKRAIKLFEEANSYLGMQEWELVVLKLQQAIEIDENFLDARTLLGQVYLETKQYDLAKEQLVYVVEKDPDFYPPIHFTLGQIAMQQGDYGNAGVRFAKFLEYPQKFPKEKRQAELGVLNAAFAKQAMANPVPFEPVNMGPGVNTAQPEYFPAITTDEQQFLFTRQLEDSRSPVGYNEDFFISRKVDGVWTEARNIGAPINSILNEGAPTFSPDGRYLIFTACEIMGGFYGEGRQGRGSCDLFISERNGNGWKDPVNMGPSVNTPNWETQPSFSSDSRSIYFIRGYRDHERYGDQDIYVSELRDGKWQRAVPLTNTINTPDREESVFIHPDNQTLYFSSNGHPGMGGLDIYVSRRQPNGEWGTPENLGYPINTHESENSFVVSASGKHAFFASDRVGGQGDLDIYMFELPEKARPVAVTYLKGRITDAKTGKPLEAKFELIDLEKNETVVESQAYEGSGEYLVSLPANKSYALNVSHPGYLFHSEHFELVLPENVKAYEKNIQLQAIETGKTVVLRNIFFDTDKYDLKPLSIAEVDRLIEFLNENPSLKIEIGGHTDSEGTDAANQVLSENRAKAVYDYLVENGIAASRLSFKGYGETKPVAANDTEEGRAQNRRTEFMVVE